MRGPSRWIFGPGAKSGSSRIEEGTHMGLNKDVYWPPLPYEAWKDTASTLHMWTQIVGKVRLSQMPWINHSWHVTLYVTPRGLTTSAIPYGERTFEIQFDFIDHHLRIDTCDGEKRALPLEPMTTAAFYGWVSTNLAELGLPVAIHPRPNEVPSPIAFPEDTTHASYDRRYAHNFFRVLTQTHRVFTTFRAGFVGKCSPVHLFWGAMDLAVTRFSGRAAPPHPGGVPHLPLWVSREAYSQEVSSAGFWAGNDDVPEALFYSYAYPQPEGFDKAVVRPEQAYFHEALGEFVLPYEVVRNADSPPDVLLEFLESTYAAAADCGRWDRDALEFALPES